MVCIFEDSVVGQAPLDYSGNVKYCFGDDMEKIPGKFMSLSKKLLEEEPDLKRKLEKVMGRVADTIVKDKYVDNSGHPKGKSKDGERD